MTRLDATPISAAEAGFAERLAKARQRADFWLRRMAEERRELEALLDTRAGAEVAERLASPLFSSGWSCELPSLDAKAFGSEREFWNAFDKALEAVVICEAKLQRLELELKETHTVVAGLRASALTVPETEDAAAASSDARRAPRIPVRTEVEFVSGKGGARGLTANISEAGLFIAAGRPPPRDEQLDLALSLPEAGWFEARGIVRWARLFDARFPRVVPGVGVEFLELDEASAEALQRFLALRKAKLP